ncbi:FadR/GntR family transcriptional regulator [Lichenicoccus sp.]|uniref:FadR/GntR family transcriptional regulator n=1 Tax=Lichenicoccus sp. TaxID=2781899 RepID=UPI003D0A28AD
MAEPAVATHRLYHQIAAEIAELIAGGGYPPGTMLPAERELAARLKVSRSSVREAVIALEVMGLVAVRVGIGVTVLPQAERLRPGAAFEMGLPPVQADPQLALHLDLPRLDLNSEVPPFALLQARRLVEPCTAALAASLANAAECRAIADALGQNRADNRAGSVTHSGDRLFHIRIARASGNPAFEMFITLLLGRCVLLFRRLQRLYAPADMPGRSEHQHEAILAAILARNPDAAHAAMAAHLDSVIALFSREIAPSNEADLS